MTDATTETLCTACDHLEPSCVDCENCGSAVCELCICGGYCPECADALEIVAEADPDAAYAAWVDEQNS